jgi:hypothetical protein
LPEKIAGLSFTSVLLSSPAASTVKAEQKSKLIIAIEVRTQLVVVPQLIDRNTYNKYFERRNFMIKILIILIASLTMVGCTNIENDYKPNNQDIPKLTDSDIRGIWDLVVPIENGGWYISSYYFYGNNKSEW